MPLRALLNGRSVIASDLSDAEWATLRGAPLHMPCCAAAAIARVSPRGLRHFAHKGRRSTTECFAPPESEDHLRAKAEIVAACRAAGYDATPEAAAPDGSWRADVLAERGSVRIAFEVQYSRQSRDETLARQRRYADAGIRGCWFVYEEPAAGAYRLSQSHFTTTERELPVFQLGGRVEEGFYAVAFRQGDRPTRVLSLGDLVRHLLAGDVRFSDRARANVAVPAEIVVFPYPCWRCGAAAVAYYVDSASSALRMSACGRAIATANEGRWEDDALDPLVIAAARQAVAAHHGEPIPLGKIKYRHSKRYRTTVLSFGCPKCDAIFDPHYMFDEVSQRLHAPGADDEIRLPVTLTDGRTSVADPHWCLPHNGEYCTPKRTRR